MPRFEDFLNLSSAVYGAPRPTITIDGPGGSQDWTFLVESGNPSDPGYYGAAYLNTQTNEIVIVNRGTNDLADLVTDVQMALDISPGQLTAAEDFYSEVRGAALGRGAKLSITGHSLGGSLTQLLVAKYANDETGGSRVFGQTFNAFGVKGLLNNLGLPERDYAVTNWVTPTDVVGNLVEHIGTRASLASLPFSYIYPAGPLGVLALFYDSHKIAQVRDTFIADNSHPLLAETREFLLQTYVTDFAFPVTIDGQVIVGGNNRINVGNELTGSVQNDLMFGGLPDDRLHGGDGQDIIYAGPGNDTIWGDAGADIMLGEDGNDTYLVDDVGDRVIEAVGGGTDTIASTVSYTLSRNVEQLILQGLDAINGTGNEFNNVLIGNVAANILDGGLGQDSMAGGAGNDTYILDNPGDSVMEAMNEGTDTVVSPFSITLAANVENITLTGTADLNGTGNELNNDLTGNDGINHLDGQDGTDHLIGGLGNDVLIGGAGNNDLLEGGAGFDTYIYNAGDGTDRIEDSDASGQIIFNGHRLLGGIHDPNDPLNTYKSLDGLTTYVLSGTDLIVNGVLTVNANFQSGQFGIELTDLSGYPADTGVPTGPFGLVMTGGSESNVLYQAPAFTGPVATFGNGGNDVVQSGLSLTDGNMADGGPGDDLVVGTLHRDYLIGGDGDDYLYSRTGDVAYGGNGNDTIYNLTPDFAPDFDHVIFTGVVQYHGGTYGDGEAGNDLLVGGLDGDRLFGGKGDDILRGENIQEGWTARIFGGPIPLWLDFVVPQAAFSTTGGADYLDGGAGNDLLVGDGGNDILSGGTGNDRLFGDDEAGYLVAPGDDMLDGGAGDDFLAGGDGDDSLSGGTGIDELFGDKGIDILDGGDGADTLRGGDGTDELFGGAGDDQLFGDGLNDLLTLSAAGGEDFLDGGAGNDHLEGGIGDDTLFGGTENDVLFGDEGADSLLGDEGNDELQGGAGNDLLSGDAGDDRLFGQADNDTLYGDEGNDQLAGNDGADTLVGGNGSDVLQGGHGTDVLIGGAGHDLYNFSLGDGQDTITDRALAGEGNVIQFFGGITLGSLSFIQDQVQQTLTIQVGGADSIRLLGFDPNTFNYVVDTLSFADGTQVALADQLPLPGGLIEGTEDSNVIRTGSTGDTIFAGTGNDVVFAGAGNDLIVGGAGADTLQGGVGQDTYVFNRGDGTDIVLDRAGEGNRLLFGPGVSASSVTLGLGVGESMPVFVRIGVAGDAIQIISNLAGGEAPSIDVLEFADGTALSIGELFERGIEITGTEGPDTLTGTNGIDRISSGGGNDVIFGGAGDDQLDGGGSNDVLNGEAGQDTYVFGRGYGQDILRDAPVEQSGPNRIQLTSGVSPEDIRLQARQSDNGIDVVLTINGTQDELTLLGASDPSLLPIDQILFADGASWDLPAILDRIEGVTVTASPTGSFLEGTGFRDVLIGGQGNDQLDGLGGADRMVGGAGDDMYWVNQSGDAVVEAVGEGQDTVLSQIDYRLPDHVENLYLRSTAQSATDPVRGEGNAAANLLLGNLVSNVLIGGEGDDIMWGGFSIGDDYGPGNDDLHGGAGNDSYVIDGSFNGFDTIHDVALPGEGNRLQFGNSVRPEDVVFVQEGANLRVTNSGGIDGAVLVDFDLSGIVGSLVTDIVAFSGGYEDVTGGYETSLLALMTPTVGTDSAEILTGTANAEVIKTQAGDDVIAGGAGNDVLLGGAGSDTYVFNQGDGFDLIDDQPGVGAINLVQFGAGITPDMLRVFYSGTFGTSGLSVLIGTSGDGLHFLGVSANDPNAPHAVDTFHFADGTQLTFAQLFERGVVVQGTGRSDGELFGTFADDVMLGLSGSEVLSSGDGNDTLIGGPGNDVLAGGRGSDTYVFNLGDGIDTITEVTGAGTNNTIVFGSGITAGDLTLGLGSLLIRVGTDGDAIHLEDFNPNNVLGGRHSIDTFRFADGTSLTYTQLIARGFDIPGTTGDDVLIGTNVVDRLIAGAGNDRVESRAGNDYLDGGTGADQLLGGRGDDTYVVDNADDMVTEQLNEGTDTIQSSISYALGANLENLTLTGTAAITGTGNTLDNVFIGNSGNNVMAGGAGADTLAGGGGDDAYLFSVGDGIDTIQDVATIGEGNRILFGVGIIQRDLTFTQDQAARTLTIQVGNSGADQLILRNFDPTNANGSLVVETLAFADGSTASLASLLGVTVNHAPTVANLLADQTVSEDAPFSIQIPTNSFADQDANDVLTYSASLADGSALSSWLSFNATTRTFTGTPDDAQVGSLDLKVTATDSGNLSVSDIFTLTVQNVNEAPIVATPLANQQATEDTPLSFVVPATTFADQDAIHGDQLTYSTTLAGGAAFPNWLSFNVATRTFSGTPLNGDVGLLNLAVKATDTGGLSATTTFALTIQNVNDVPIVANPIADHTVLEDAPFTITVPENTFADEDVIHGDTLTYNASLANGTALPSWLSFNPTTWTFTGTPDDTQVGSLSLKVTVTDSGNLSALDVFTLTVQNVNEAPTVAALLADQQATQGMGFSFVVSANTFSDPDAGDTLTYSARLANGNLLPAWLNFNTTTRTFSGTPGVGNVGTLDVRVTATDTGALSANDVFALTIAATGGTPGNDTLIGTPGNDLLDGLAGDDILQGLAGNDTLIGGAGNDLLDGGAGTDTMTGGAGNDTYVVDAVGDVVTENLNEGTDTVQSSITYTLGANVENLTLTGTAAINGTGNALDNVLTGNSAANVLTGGAGNDTYIVGTGDTVVETANNGLDTVQSNVTWTLGANLEALTLTGTANINGTGNTLDNLLTGNSGANVLTGGAGNDIYVISAGDTVVEGTGAGTDTVLSDVTATLGTNVELLVLTGTNAINGTGNSLANTITGNNTANVLDGGAGADILAGLDGNDTYIVDNSGDLVVELANNGIDRVQSSVTHTLAANVENLTLTPSTGSGQVNGTGNGLNNVLTGNSAVNTLTGADGNDSLRGNGGNDTLNGGNGNDTFLFGRGEGQDLVQDNSGTADKLLYDAGINPLDLVISRQANDLRLAIHGGTNQVMIQNWYVGMTNRTETIQAGNGQTLLSTQVDQLIQAMASFSQQSGLTWDQAIDQQPAQVQSILAASWQ